MQRKDITLIVVVVIFAGVFSLVVSKFFFTTDKQENLTAEVVQEITSDFDVQPDKSVFNERAINPTKLIQIGDSTNPQPF